MNTLGDRIKKIRGKDTQKKFAEKLGISPRALFSYEKNERIPSADIISHICAINKVSSNWLLSGEGEMYEKTSPVDLAEIDRRFRESDDYPNKIQEINNNLSKLAEEHLFYSGVFYILDNINSNEYNKELYDLYNSISKLNITQYKKKQLDILKKLLDAKCSIIKK